METDIPPLAEEFVITDPETLKVISDARRLKIIRALYQPKTPKEVAALVEMPQTKLYYHLNQLEKFGLISVIATNVVSGIIEKTYRVSARRFRVDETALMGQSADGNELSAMISAVFDNTRDELLRSTRTGLTKTNQGEKITPRRDALSRGHIRLTEEQADALVQKLAVVVEEAEQMMQENEADPSAKNFGFLLTVYPVLIDDTNKS